jgi:predicted outer membrane repeat protein
MIVKVCVAMCFIYPNCYLRFQYCTGDIWEICVDATLAASNLSPVSLAAVPGQQVHAPDPVHKALTPLDLSEHEAEADAVHRVEKPILATLSSPPATHRPVFTRRDQHDQLPLWRKTLEPHPAWPASSSASLMPVLSTAVTTATETITITTAVVVGEVEVAVDPVVTSIRVDSAVADAPANISACDPALQARADNGTGTGTGGSCNLRSAVAYCDSILTARSVECVISLPPMEDLYMNPHYGEMLLQDNRGALRLEGNGCHIALASTNTTSRLFKIKDTINVDIRRFSFSLSNATISGFGSDMVDGGAMYFYSMSVVMDLVVFRDNVGLAGGALCFDKCRDINLASVQLVNNTAASDGGGIYMASENNDVNFTSCDFIGNSVLGTKMSTIGTGYFTGKFSCV